MYIYTARSLAKRLRRPRIRSQRVRAFIYIYIVYGYPLGSKNVCFPFSFFRAWTSSCVHWLRKQIGYIYIYIYIYIYTIYIYT